MFWACEGLELMLSRLDTARRGSMVCRQKNKGHRAHRAIKHQQPQPLANPHPPKKNKLKSDLEASRHAQNHTKPLSLSAIGCQMSPGRTFKPIALSSLSPALKLDCKGLGAWKKAIFAPF